MTNKRDLLLKKNSRLQKSSEVSVSVVEGNSKILKQVEDLDGLFTISTISMENLFTPIIRTVQNIKSHSYRLSLRTLNSFYYSAKCTITTLNGLRNVVIHYGKGLSKLGSLVGVSN